MLLIQPGISLPLLALYLNLHHSSKTNRNPTAIFTTMANNNDIAILIILSICYHHEVFYAVNNIV